MRADEVARVAALARVVHFGCVEIDGEGALRHRPEDHERALSVAWALASPDDRAALSGVPEGAASAPEVGPEPSPDCRHPSIQTFTNAEVGLSMWACADCKRRFYPACPTCVVVGHRGEHPVPSPKPLEGWQRSVIQEAVERGVVGARLWLREIAAPQPVPEDET